MKQKPTHRPRQQNCGCHVGWGAREGVWWEFGASRSKLFYVGWIDNEAPLYSTADYSQCLVIKNHHGKEHEHENRALQPHPGLKLFTSSDRWPACRHPGRPRTEEDFLREDPCSTPRYDAHCSYPRAPTWMTGCPCGHGRLEGGQGLELPGWANEAFVNLLKDRLLEPSRIYLPVTMTFLPAPGELEGYRKREWKVTIDLFNYSSPPFGSKIGSKFLAVRFSKSNQRE